MPRGQARIRVQLSAAHERSDLEAAVAAFAQAGRELGMVHEVRAYARVPGDEVPILIIGSNGQIGTELAEALIERHGERRW